MGGSEIKHLDLTQIKTDICCFLNSTWIVEGHNCIHQIHFIIYSKLVPKMTFSSSLEHKVSNIKISEVFPILCCTPLYKIVSVYGLHSAEEKNSLKKKQYMRTEFHFLWSISLMSIPTETILRFSFSYFWVVNIIPLILSWIHPINISKIREELD